MSGAYLRQIEMHPFNDFHFISQKISFIFAALISGKQSVMINRMKA
jgi:hypothetical protein